MVRNPQRWFGILKDGTESSKMVRNHQRWYGILKDGFGEAGVVTRCMPINATLRLFADVQDVYITKPCPKKCQRQWTSISLTYHTISSTMGVVVKVFAFEHFSSSASQNVQTWNPGYPSLFTAISCWLLKKAQAILMETIWFKTICGRNRHSVRSAGANSPDYSRLSVWPTVTR